MIFGSGPLSTSIAVIGEWPGKDEVQAEENMIGPSSRIQWQLLYAEAGGIRPEHCFKTNLVKVMPTEEQEKKGLTDEDRASWGAILDDELRQREPRFILTCGKHSAQHFLGVETKLQHVHGIPRKLEMPWGEVWLVPSIHAASGMRDSKELARVAEDYHAFGEVVAGRGVEWKPRSIRPDYGRATKREIEQMFKGVGSYVPEIAIDTEYDGGDPLMLTFSTRRGWARMILAEETELLALFAEQLRIHRPTVYGHNWLADITPLKKMGVDLVAMGLPLRDTMARLWYMETEPQGLKPATWRHEGADVTEFEAVVQPYFDAQLLNYLAGGLELTKPASVERYGKPNKKGERKRLKAGTAPASPLHRRIKRFLGDSEKGRVRNLFDRWHEWEKDGDAAELERVLGDAPRFSLRRVPLEASTPYACADADYTISIARNPKLQPYSYGLEEKDCRRLPLLNAMQERGVQLDKGRWETVRDELRAEQKTALEVLRIVTERDDFNPNSADDIAEALYGAVKAGVDNDGRTLVYEFLKDKEYLLPPGFTKRKQPKTDKKALGTLRAEDPVLPALLLDYKEIEKLLNTYVEPVPRLVAHAPIVGHFWTLHPNIRHTRVPTGRLAMVRPNLMAIPARTARGARIRWMFVAREGFKLMSFDHSQIELRVAACLTRDPVMMSAFLDGVDLHTRTAAKISGKDEADSAYWKSPSGKMFRALFKQINFGILYGATAMRIYLELLAQGIRTYTLPDCERFVQQWFGLFANVLPYIEMVAESIRRTGYVEDMWGRRRRLPAAYLQGRKWPMVSLREEAERQGFNHQIQGGAQGLLINAMLYFSEHLLPALHQIGYGAYPLLQIHDELIFEVEDREEPITMMKELGLATMKADQSMFQVPIEAGCSVGADWSELK